MCPIIIFLVGTNVSTNNVIFLKKNTIEILRKPPSLLDFASRDSRNGCPDKQTDRGALPAH